MEERVEYGDRQGFNVEILSRGSRASWEGGGLHQLDAYVLQLSNAALKGYETIQAIRETHKFEYVALRRAWREDVVKAIGIDPDTDENGLIITQINEEIFAVVWIRRLEI